MKTFDENITYTVRDGPHQDGTHIYGPNAGAKQHNVLTFTGDTASGETVTIGSTVYEFRESGAATTGNIKVDVSGGKTNLLSVTALVAAIKANDPYFTAIDLTGGAMLVVAKVAGLSGYLGRLAITGTAADAELVTIGSQLYEFDTAATSVSGTSYTAGRYPVNISGTGNDANTKAAAALVTVINATHPYVIAVNAGSGNVDIYTKIPYIRAGTTTAGLTFPVAPYIYLAETMGNGAWTTKDGHYVSTETCTNAAWSLDTAKMVGGVPAVIGKIAFVKRVCTTADVSYTKVLVPLDFAPTGFQVELKTSAGAAKAYDGAVAYDLTSKCLVLDETGASDFANTDVLHIVAWE